MPAIRHVFVALLVVVVIAGSAEGQKRRSVRSGAPAAPSNDCHTFSLVRAGLKATYLTTAPGGNVNFTINYISHTPTQLKTTQQVSAPTGNADVVTTVDAEIVGNLSALKHIDVKTTTVVPILGSITAETDIDFVPSLVSGPAQGWCTGATWNIPPSTETIVVQAPTGPITTVVTTIASTGEVLAVGESVTVPAGTFRTVKYRGIIVANNSVQTAITWTSMDHSIVVKQDTIDAGGAVTSVTSLTGLQ